MFTRTFSLSFNSDPTTGAIPLGNTGANFSVDLNTPIAFDRTATAHVEGGIDGAGEQEGAGFQFVVE